MVDGTRPERLSQNEQNYPTPVARDYLTTLGITVLLERQIKNAAERTPELALAFLANDAMSKAVANTGFQNDFNPTTSVVTFGISQREMLAVTKTLIGNRPRFEISVFDFLNDYNRAGGLYDDELDDIHRDQLQKWKLIERELRT
jgi:hypothetical protein